MDDLHQQCMRLSKGNLGREIGDEVVEDMGTETASEGVFDAQSGRVLSFQASVPQRPCDQFRHREAGSEELGRQERNPKPFTARRKQVECLGP